MYVSNPSACHGNETSTLKHTLSNFIKKQTFGASRRLLSMYVCLKTLSLSWKLASNKNRLMMIWTKNVSTCSKTLSLSWKSNIHTRLNFLEFHIFESFSDAFKHVCMFQIPLPVMENETYTLKYTRSIHLKPCFAYLNKYVWKKIQNPSACHAFCNSNSTQISEGHRFFKFSKRYSARYYINTSIHTYILRIRPSH